MEQNRPQKILIASPLEPEQAERIAAAAPGRIEVIFAPDLLPVPRYVADHDGRPRALSAAQRAQWLAHLREADILFDFDWLAPERLLEHAPRLRWVQGTSAGIGERLRRTGLIDSDLAVHDRGRRARRAARRVRAAGPALLLSRRAAPAAHAARASLGALHQSRARRQAGAGGRPRRRRPGDRRASRGAGPRGLGRAAQRPMRHRPMAYVACCR